MNGKNIFDYQGVIDTINSIKSSDEEARDYLNNMTSLIDTAIGSGADAWSGTSAVSFKNDWDENVASKISANIENIEIQIENLRNAVEAMKAADTATNVE